MLILITAIYVLAGLIAGFSSGVIGIGGGVIVVPILYWAFYKAHFPLPMHMAVCTSLAIMIFTSLSSTISQAAKKNIQWKIIAYLIFGTLIGGILGPQIAKGMSPKMLRYAFGAFDIIIGILFLLQKKNTSETSEKVHKPFLKFLTFSGVGLGISIIGTLLGTGGGFIFLPVVMALGYETKKVMGTATAFTLILSIIGTIVYYFMTRSAASPLGLIHLRALIAVAIGALCGAPLGAYLSSKLNMTAIKCLFIGFIILAAIVMFS